MALAVLLFCIGLVLLVKGGDWFVDGAVALARSLRLPEVLIGATVVSIGTTLPEVMVSTASAVMGHGELAYGNAIGSVICNTALVAALTAAIRPGAVNRKALRMPAVFFFLAALFYMSVAYFSGIFSRAVGVVLLVLFLVYMVVTLRQMRQEAADASSDSSPNDQVQKSNQFGSLIVKLLGGAAAVALGARLLVDNGTLIAQALGVPESVIALTFVALGTSLPELVTAITALSKGHSALSLGNVIGANFFNLVLVSGVASTLAPFELPTGTQLFQLNASLVVDLPVMLLTMALLAIPALLSGKLYRSQGIALLLIYALFCVGQFVLL